MDFFTEFKKLVFSSPRNSLHHRVVENSDFADYIARSKNIYLSYFIDSSEDCYYSEYLANCRDCVDCMAVVASELCYECVDSSSLYNCSFVQDCHNCSHCNFSYDCLNCKDCFGCFGLRHKQFCIFNKPYTEGVYREKIAQLTKNAPRKILEILQPEFEKYPRLYARLLKGNEKCVGDYIYFSKNSYSCFNIRNTEDSWYVSDIFDPELLSHTSMDCTFASHIENCYEAQNIVNCTNSNFLENCANCSDCDYVLFCYNCSNCFGCVYSMNKEYCILNRQFTREEYFVAVAQMKKQLKGNGTYGKTLADIVRNG